MKPGLLKYNAIDLSGVESDCSVRTFCHQRGEGGRRGSVTAQSTCCWRRIMLKVCTAYLYLNNISEEREGRKVGNVIA